jgi:hypothetical protein
MKISSVAGLRWWRGRARGDEDLGGHGGGGGLFRWRGRPRGRKIAAGAEPTVGEELVDDRAAALPVVAACCRVRSQGGVGDGILRVSRVLGWNWHRANISEDGNGPNSTIDFQEGAKHASVRKCIQFSLFLGIQTGSKGKF